MKPGDRWGLSFRRIRFNFVLYEIVPDLWKSMGQTVLTATFFRISGTRHIKRFNAAEPRYFRQWSHIQRFNAAEPRYFRQWSHIQRFNAAEPRYFRQWSPIQRFLTLLSRAISAHSQEPKIFFRSKHLPKYS